MSPRKRHFVGPQARTAFLLAFGAGFTAVELHAKDATLRTLVVSFLAASLPVLAMHLSHSRSKPAPAESPK